MEGAGAIGIKRLTAHLLSKVLRKLWAPQEQKLVERTKHPLEMCRMTANAKFLLIILSSKQYVSHGGLIYNLIQELGVSRLTQRDCPFRVETPTM